MQITSTLSLLLIAFTSVNAHENFTSTKDATDSLLRYKNPLPSSAFKANTRLGLTNFQDANPGTLVYPENGGYYLKYPDSGIVVAFSSDNLSAVLDLAHISLYRNLQSQGNLEEAANLAQELAENGVVLHKFAQVDLYVHNRCRSHYCAYPGLTGACALYDGCYWCSSRHSCIQPCKWVRARVSQEGHVTYPIKYAINEIWKKYDRSRHRRIPYNYEIGSNKVARRDSI